MTDDALPTAEDRVGRALAGVSRRAALVLVSLAYLVAATAGFAIAWASPGHPLARTLYGDLTATIVIFALSTVVNNASLYDPYWSVAPPVIVAGWLATGLGAAGVGWRQVVVLVLITAWAVRLTANWGWGWSGFRHEDWRYQMLREQTRHRVPWWLVNLTGIQLMPTIVVYIGLFSAWPAITSGRTAFGVLDALAIVVIAGSVIVESTADIQLRRFTADPAHLGRTADIGLWRRSRHPNYLGEIGFWCGLYLFGLAAAPGWWWTVVGPIVMVVLFAMVSVPLMDRRSLARRTDYAQYLNNVPALLPRVRRTG